MPNYNNGKIYRIVCNETGEQYIGSTTLALSQRLAHHTHSIKHNSKFKCKSSSIIERVNYEIVLLEEYPCENKEQLLRRERHYIETMVCVNKIIPLRTKPEYYQDNKEQIIEHNKQYYQDNKEQSLERQKRYAQTHREQKKEHDKQYRQANKERINARQRELYALKKQNQTLEV